MESNESGVHHINVNTQNVKLLLLVSECRFDLGLTVRVNVRKRYIKCLRNELVCVCAQAYMHIQNVASTQELHNHSVWLFSHVLPFVFFFITLHD